MKTLLGTLFLVTILLLTHDLKAEIQYNLQSDKGGAYFTVDSDSTVYLDASHRYTGGYIALEKSSITNFGYYYYDHLVEYIKMSGDLTGGPSGGHKFGPDGVPLNMPTLHYGNMKTGVLGEFKADDKIVLWIETTSADGKKSTFTTFNPGTTTSRDLWMLSDSGDYIVFNWGDYFGTAAQTAVNTGDFKFAITTNNPNGQPLPGIIATLLVGGGGLLYLKKRKNKKRSAKA